MSPNKGMKRQREEEEPEASTNKDESNSIKTGKHIVGNLLRALEDSYKNNHRPYYKEMSRLAAETGLTFPQVRGWFERKRFKVKKLNSELIVNRMREENKKNSSATKMPIEHESNVVHPSEVTTMDIPIEVIDLYCSYM